MSRHPPRPQRLASLQDAASYADLSVRTIRRYIATGRITGYRVGPHLIKVDLDDFDKLAVPKAAWATRAKTEAESQPRHRHVTDW